MRWSLLLSVICGIGALWLVGLGEYYFFVARYSDVAVVLIFLGVDAMFLGLGFAQDDGRNKK